MSSSMGATHTAWRASAQQLANGPHGQVWGCRQPRPACGIRPGDASWRCRECRGRRWRPSSRAPDGALWTYRLGVLEEWRWSGARWQPARTLSSAQGVPAIEAMDLRADSQGRLARPRAVACGGWTRGAPRGLPVARAFGPRDGLSSGSSSAAACAWIAAACSPWCHRGRQPAAGRYADAGYPSRPATVADRRNQRGPRRTTDRLADRRNRHVARY